MPEGTEPIGLVAVRKPVEPGTKGAVPFIVGYGAPPDGIPGAEGVGCSGEMEVFSSLGTSGVSGWDGVPVSEEPPAV